MVNPSPQKGAVISIKVLDRLKQDMVDAGLVTKEKLRLAETTAQRENKTLSDILIKLGFVTQEQLVSFMGEAIHVPYVNLRNYTVDSEGLERIPEKIARRYKIIPLFMLEGVLTVAISDPLDIISIDEISKVAQCKIEPVIASKEGIDMAIDQWYGGGDARKELIEQLVDEFKEAEGEEESKYAKEIAEIRLKKEAAEPLIVRLVNSFIAQAILENASDIHLGPKRDCMEVRFRIDGFLYQRHRLPAELIPQITSRIKILSGLDITKRRIPQDGRIGIIVRNKIIDIRTSTFPSMYGENIVLRILDKTKGTPTLPDLGLSEKDLNTFNKVIKSTKGLILATGPTGSGKTTTLYSLIDTLNKVGKNIMTVEDPIEYEIEGIVQTNVDYKSGFNFANAISSILRQDPDIIYVGEIRDPETAKIAVRAALTGHLVLSTLHTNDAVGAIVRLMDIGIEAGLIGSILTCSFAQRLVRKICPRCKNEYQPDEKFLVKSGLSSDTKFYKGEGCEFCSGIGYRGRIGIFEIVNVNKDIATLITKEASEDVIMKAVRKQGMKSMFEDGLRKVKKGITTIEEVMRVSEE